MSERSFKKPRILIAEDDKSIAEVLTLLLRDYYEVITPNSFVELESFVSDQKFDLVLLDVSLWGNDCISLSTKIRSGKESKVTPIILLSARSDLNLIASRVNANEIIEKPFEIDLLLKTIKKFLNPTSV